jgi:DNA-binding beta-propeller fold protein YncE
MKGGKMAVFEKTAPTAATRLEEATVDLGHYRIRAVEVHATCLRLPGHMGLTADGRVLVSEFAAGCIRDVTEGGDYRDPTRDRWAWNLANPGGIHPTPDGHVYVADSGSGGIYDISEPGAVTEAQLVFDGVPHPYSLLEFGDSLYVSYSNNAMAGVTKVTPGGSFSLDRRTYVQDFPVVRTMEPYRAQAGCGGSWATVLKDGRFMFGHAALGAIFDVTEGGTYDELRERRYAWGLTLPLGMTVDPLDANLYVAERSTGIIKRIPHAGGYSRFAEPLLAGFQEPSCVRFTPDGAQAYVCDRGVDAVYRLELEHAN